MLEAMIFSICFGGNLVACENAGQAYYQHSGIDKMVQSQERRLSRNYPIVAMFVPIVVAAQQNKLEIPLFDKFSLQYSNNSSIIGYKTTF